MKRIKTLPGRISAYKQILGFKIHPVMKTILLVFLIGLMTSLPGCVTARGHEKPSHRPEKASTLYLYVINHGWHTGIALKRSDISVGLLPIKADFPNAEFLEIGWGDRDYYQTADPRMGQILKAALWPTDSVLHVAGFKSTPVIYFSGNEIIRINIGRTDMDKLEQFIDSSFASDKSGKVKFLGPGLYGDSKFYPSSETYHLFKTCNVWIAKALQSAGIPVNSLLALSTENLMAQLEPYGDIVQTSLPRP